MEQIQPLPKALYDQLVEAGIDSFELQFQGGSDEGYLEVVTTPYGLDPDRKIEDWAWSAYGYSGAGEGSSYGDDITYDLKNKTASCHEWYMDRVEGGTEEGELEIE